MDLDPWHLSDSTGIESDVGYGQCEYNFRYVPDTIEEHAANEKSCVEVLNRMIAKADTEILDLEDELAILQCQLSWSKHENLYEFCSSAFREKIASVSQSLQTIRNGHTHNSSALNADSGTHHEPVERIHDTITALLENYNSTESNKESIIAKADIEENENTISVTTNLGFSRKPDYKQIVDSRNQVPDSETKGESNAVQGAVNGSEAIIQEDCEGKGGTEQCTLSASQAIILWQQDCDGKGETEQRTPVESLPRGVEEEVDVNGSLPMILFSPPSKGKKVKNPKRSRIETDHCASTTSQSIILSQQDCEGKVETEHLTPVDHDVNEPLAMVLYSQPSKRKKTEMPKRSRIGIAKEGNQTFRLNCMTVATPNSRFSLASEVSGRNSDLGRKKSAASNGRSQLARSAEMGSPSIVSDCTRENLEKMKKLDLVAVAKRHGVKKFYKAKKSLLVEMILSHVAEIEWTPCTE